MTRRATKATVQYRSVDEAKAETLSRLACAAAGEFDIRLAPGAESAKRALEIAAAGGHRIAVLAADGQHRLIRDYLVAAFAAGAPGAVIVDDPGQAEMVIHVHVEDIDIALPPPAESGASIAARVAGATSRTPPGRLDVAANALLDLAVERALLDATTRNIVEAVARSIAGLDGTPTVRRLHVAEALSYRPAAS